MGEAEREPSTSERDTEKPEVERRAREPDGKTRRRPEMPEVSRRRRTPLPEVVEEYRRRPSVSQSGFPVMETQIASKSCHHKS
nr:serine/arginine repetitive matrix protein 1-like [Odocoileus virginianus texanus]